MRFILGIAINRAALLLIIVLAFGSSCSAHQRFGSPQEIGDRSPLVMRPDVEAGFGL